MVRKGNNELCTANSKTVADYARRFSHGHWSFLGPGSEKKWCGSRTYKPNGDSDQVAEDMMINFSESGHPVFLASSALKRGSLRSKGKGKLSIHVCGDAETVEVILRTIISVNQLSVYGAVADMRDELAWRISGCSESTGRPVAENNSWTMVMPTELSTTNKPPQTNEPVQGDLLRDHERKFANLPEHLQLIRLCSGEYHEDCVQGAVFHVPRRCGT